MMIVSNAKRGLTVPTRAVLAVSRALQGDTLPKVLLSAWIAISASSILVWGNPLVSCVHRGTTEIG